VLISGRRGGGGRVEADVAYVLAVVGMVQAAWRYWSMSPLQVECRRIGRPDRYSTTSASFGARCPRPRCGRWVSECSTYSSRSYSSCRWLQVSVRLRSSRRTVPTQRSAYAFATSYRAGYELSLSVAAEHLIEHSDELAGSVAEQEPDRQFGTHDEVPCSLGRPSTVRIRVMPTRCTRCVWSSMKNKT